MREKRFWQEFQAKLVIAQQRPVLLVVRAAIARENGPDPFHSGQGSKLKINAKEGSRMPSFEDEVDPKHTALIVIDVQNDFCQREGGICRSGKDVSLIQAMVPNLVEFIAKARENGVAIVFVRSANSPWIDSRAWLERMKVAGDDEDYLVRENSWGAEFYLVQPQASDRIVVKPRYSAFYGTDLDIVLRARGIKTLIMTGVTTNVCVETSSRDGFQRDYNIVLVENCCAATNTENHLAALRNIKNYFGKVAGSGDVVKAWAALSDRTAKNLTPPALLGR